MPDISIQFHALPEELLPFARDFAIEFDLHVVAIRFFPFEAEEIETDRISEVLSDPRCRRVAFTLANPSLSGTTGNRFEDQNPESLVLEIGRRTDKGLKESWLRTRTSNPKTLKIWNQAARRLKEITSAGAIAVNPQTGASARVRSHRFTKAAKKLELAGVPILPTAGTAILKLGGIGRSK